MTVITDDSAGTIHHGSASIGATPAQLSASKVPLTRGVKIKAGYANTGRLYVGTVNTVTAASAGATDGFELAAGDSEFFPIDDLSKIWIIASGAGQAAYFSAF